MRENAKQMIRLSPTLIYWNTALDYLVVPYKPKPESQLKGVSHVFAYRFTDIEGDRWKATSRWIYNKLHERQEPEQLPLMKFF